MSSVVVLIKRVLVVFVAVQLAACGGGGTTSGGMPPTSALAGAYNGTFTFTSTPTSVPEAAVTESGSVTVEINPSARMVVRFSNGGLLVGTLSSNNTFTLTDTAANATGDDSCVNGLLTISGSASASGVSGDVISQDLVCSGFDIDLVGSFNASPA